MRSEFGELYGGLDKPNHRSQTVMVHNDMQGIASNITKCTEGNYREVMNNSSLSIDQTHLP